MPSVVRSHHVRLAVATSIFGVRSVTALVDTGAKEICNLDALVADPRAHVPGIGRRSGHLKLQDAWMMLRAQKAEPRDLRERPALLEVSSAACSDVETERPIDLSGRPRCLVPGQCSHSCLSSGSKTLAPSIVGHQFG